MKSQLWNQLKQAELVTGENTTKLETESPWYVKVLLAFSGWLAAIFLLAFFMTWFPHLYKEPILASSIGVGLILSAFFLFRTKSNEFVEHLALAVSLAGQALLIFAFNQFYQTNEEVMVWFSISVTQLLLALFMPNYVHRVSSSFVAGIGFAATLFYYQNGLTGSTFYSAFLMLLTAVIWLYHYKFPKQIITLQAIGFGLTLALIILNVTELYEAFDAMFHRYSFSYEGLWLQPWMREVLFGIITLFVTWTLLKNTQTPVSNKTIVLALIGTALLSLLSTQAHGLAVGVMIILLGFSISNRVLLGLGVLSLLFFISYYYYSLQISLLNKSITLLGLGVGLLIARWLMIQLLPTPHMTQEELA